MAHNAPIAASQHHANHTAILYVNGSLLTVQNWGAK